MADNATDNNAPTVAPTQVPIPTEKRGKEEREAFHLVPVERTMEELYTRGLEQQEIDDFVKANIDEINSDIAKHNKAMPKMGASITAYQAAKEEWRKKNDDLKKRLDYYTALQQQVAEATRSQMKENYDNIQPRDVVEMTPDEFIAEHLPRITPESFKSETGLSNSEQAGLVGYIAGKDKGGMTVEEAAENILENYDSELRGLGFTGDMQDVRNAIIDILSSGNPRSYAKRGLEQRNQESIDQQRAEMETVAAQSGFSSVEEMAEYESVVVPRIIETYKGFDENEYYNNLAENYGNDTTRESESIGQGSELLQGEQAADNNGAPTAGVGNQGGAVSNNVQGGGQDGTPQGNQQVNELVGNSEQLSSSEIPNNQSVTEGNAPGQSGVYADNQGNPVDADGKLIVDEVNSIDEITDEDFETPTRNVQLPVIPENVANAIGTNGRPVVIKRNVFEKNGNTHVELEPEDSRNILRSALYNPNLVGSTQPIRRPDYKVAIRTGDQNAVVVLDVYQEKDFVEIVGWRMVNEKGLAKMQRQAEREGGQFLILSPNDGSAAALSALPLGLSSASEDTTQSANSQENAQKSGENTTLEQIKAELKDLRKKIAVNGNKLKKMLHLPKYAQLTADYKYFNEYLDSMDDDRALAKLGIIKRAWNADAFDALWAERDQLKQQIKAAEERLKNAESRKEKEENAPEIQEPRSVEEMLDNGDKRITNYNSRGEVATVAIERDGKVVSVDSYDEGVLFEHTEYDGNGKATSVTRYDKQGNVVGTQVYEDGKAKTPMQKLADRILDRTEEKRRIPLRERARELEAQVGVKANIIESLDEVKNREARKRIAAGEPVAGWYSGGQVYLYMPNIKDKREIELTYVHEVVAHHGVKKLLGERFNEFLDGVWNMMSEADRARMLAYVGANENPTLQDMRAAADEYVAELAEKMNLGELEQSTWEKIVDWFKELLENIGFENLTKEDIESMLKASYANLRSTEQRAESKENDFRARMTFHGSGAQFDSFDHAFMGTGEGAQAFGWGTYVTEVEGIGKQYAEAQAMPHLRTPQMAVYDDLSRYDGDFYSAKQNLLDYYNSVLEKYPDNYTIATRKNLLEDITETDYKKSHIFKSRNLYSVEIPDDNGSNYLHWEDVVPRKVETAVKERLLERLSEGQGEAYKSDLKQELDDVFRYSDFDGASLYKNISAYLGGDKQASQFLSDMGFVGISYPAEAATGGRADGARNYVIFNENDAEIKDRTMFRKKDSERRQEKRRINDIIDTAAGFVTVGGKKQATKNRLKKEAERKQLAKEIYSSVLKGDFNDVTLSQIDKFIEDATPANPFGRRISQRLPQRMERALRQGARTNAVDALFSRICESTVPANERFSEAGRREIEERKKELLKGWAIATGNWHTNLKEFTDDTEPIGEGKDSKVYMSKDGNSVIKASKGKPFGKKFRPDIDNIPLFNDVFKNSRYEILGYGEIDGQFVRILKQDFIDFAESTPLTPEERKEYMGKLGFKPLNKDYTAFSNGEIVIADLQKSNIVKDAAGNISVIDADAKLHTKDVGGDYTYPPVEEDLPEQETRFRTIGGNSGYVGYSMSKRAAEAREEGRYPKSDFKKEYGVSGKSFDLLQKAGIIYNSEWHHTSKFGNRTDFYSWDEPEFAEYYAANKKRIDKAINEVEKLKPDYNEVRAIDKYLSEGRSQSEIRDLVDEDLRRIEPAEKAYNDARSKLIEQLKDEFYDLPEDSGTRFRIANENQEIFVSNAQRAVEGIQQNKATAEQWIAMLKKNGGLKAGEDAWLGLEEWLNEKQGAVTKQEILDYIAQNRIQIEEVQYDENAIDIDNVFDEYEEIYDLKGEEEAHKVMIERYGENFFEAFKEIGGELRVQNDKLALQILKNEINSTRLGYTTDGLENKREIALTVPTIEPYNASDEVHFGDAGNGRAVAWVRFGETTDSEGNRVLVIDEIQSKRHQDAREKGYVTEEYIYAKRELDYLYKKMYEKGLTGEEHERYKWLQQYTADNFGIVPEAPFEKNWHELAMKRMLRLAAEEGFDKVAWTTGEQQAERYNIGKVIDGLTAYKIFPNGYYVVPYRNRVIDSLVKIYNDIELAETFGKEIATDIVLNAENATEENPYEIKGDGLRIGGEGMKGFYDRMLPSFVQKYTKKWGAKVGEVTMPSLGENNTMWSVDVTPEMQESVMQGQTMFRMVAYDKAVQIADEFANTHKGATKRVVISKGKEALEQQMRDAGFTDFSIEVALKNYEGEENPTDGAYYVSSDGIVIYDAENLNATLWHENAHRAIHRLLGDNLSELQRAFDNLPKVLKDRTVAFLEAKGYTPEEFPKEAVAFFIEGAYTDGVFNDGNYDITRFFKGVDDNVGVFYNFVQNVINNIEYEREETDNSGIYLGESTQQQLPERNGESYENGTRADATEGAAGSGTQEGETRFRTVEDVIEQQQENEVRLAREAVTSIGEKLNSPVKIMDYLDSVPENRRNRKGWFDPKTGEVVVVMPNLVSSEDAVQTVLHEAVGYKGLSGILGERFNELLDGVYKGATPSVKRAINDRFFEAIRNGRAITVREATERVIADSEVPGVKEQLRGVVRDATGVELPDGELRYLLWKNVHRGADGVVETVLDRAKEAETGTGDTRFRRAEPVRAVDTYNKNVKGFKNKFKEGWYDEMRSLKVAQEAIEKELGKELMDSENVYLYANHIPSINKNKKEVFDNKYLKPFTSLLKRLYEKKVNGNKLDEKAIERYTNAKHGIERNREMSVKNALTEVQDGKKVFNENAYKSWAQERDEVRKKNLPWAEEQRELDRVARKYGAKIRDYSGLTAIFDKDRKMKYAQISDAAYQYVADVENALGKDVKELWGLIKGMTDYSLNEAFESGMMSKATYEHIKQMYRYYVPLRGFTEQTAEDFFDYVEGDHSPLNAVVKTAYGRTSEADNIFATILNMANSAIVQGSKNRLKQRLLNLAMRSRTRLLSVDNAWYEKKGDTYEPVNYPDKANEYADFEERMKDKEKRGEVVRHRPGLDIGKKVAETWNKTQHAVRVKRNGREYVVWVNGEPAMANAINGLLRQNFDNTWLGSVNRFRAQMVTQYSPTFVFTNLLRDVQESSVTYAVRRGLKMTKDFEKNVARNTARMMKLYLKHKNGTLNENIPVERYFKEFLENGGETGYTEMISIEQYEKQIKKLTQGLNMKNATRKALETFGDGVEFANRCVENLCRFSAYQTSREGGISILKSIEDAKEVSVNFNRKGSGAMGQKYAKVGYMFLNPAIQSLAKRLLLTKKYPKKMAAVWAGEFIMGATAPMLYMLIRALMGDDEDELWGNYYNLTDYRRRSNLCLPFKDGVFHIPLSHEARAFYGLGELCTSFVMGHEEYDNIPMQMFNTLSQVLPLNPLDGWAPGENILESMAYNLTPDAAKPIAEVVMNRDFAGNKIHNRSDFNEHLPEYMRGKRGTADIFTDISELLSGKDVYGKSWFDTALGTLVNPSTLEHLVEGYLGGAYTFADKAIKSTKWALGDEEYAEFKNIPIGSSFYTSLAKYEDKPTESRTRRDWEDAFRFYDQEVKWYNDKEKAAKNGEKNGEESGTLTLEQMERNGELLMIDIFNDGNEKLKELYGASDVARRNGEFDKVEEIDQQIYAEKRNIVSLMEQLADDPMVGYTFKRNKIEGPYGERETYGDVRDAKIINDIQTELKPLYEEYKDAYDWGDNTKEEDLWYELADIERDISDAKSDMKDPSEDADELMAEIRELRAEAIELRDVL